MAICPVSRLPSDFESYIVAPALGEQAGVIGALHLAREVCSESSTRDEGNAELAAPGG